MPAARQAILLLVVACSLASAQQSTPYILTEFPIAAMPADLAVWVKWTGASRRNEKWFRPDSGRVYYSTSPGGSRIENYTDSITVFAVDTQQIGQQTSLIVLDNVPIEVGGDEAIPPQRGISFRARDQKNMGPGVYYYMVGWKTKISQTIGPVARSIDTTFFSNELQFIVEADTAPELISPDLKDEITDLTPTFEWGRNPGVPYFHVIVTDEEIKIETDSSGEQDSVNVQGLSIIWEAISPGTQITYGAADPSGTLVASPPPLSPGQTYSWVVLNNYGNHPAYTSYRVFALPRTFTVLGEQLEAPENVSPKDSAQLSAARDSTITFTWTNLDPRANTYKVYLYVASDLENIGAQLVVWEDEVSSGQFKNDTGHVTVNARSILTNNRYTWKVIAVDARGAGKAGNITGFDYEAPTGQLKIVTKEKIQAGATTLVASVSAVKIEVEVLDGSMEAPLLYYTDTSGVMKRDRPGGTYRITAVKDGFLPLTRTVSVDSGETTLDTFYLERPDATVFGKVVDADGNALSTASVHGVSELGDTVTTQTDALGGFVLSCYESDWVIWAQAKGYISSPTRDTTVLFGQSVQLTPFTLQINPNVLSGVIKNELGLPLIGVQVKLFNEGVLVDKVPSTPQTGAFSFAVEAGRYTLTASKTGFASYSKTVEVLSSKNMTITMASRAAVVKGAVYGRTWGPQGRVYAPITGATILFVNSGTGDTIRAVSDPVYGDYTISLPGANNYIMSSSALGYISKTRSTPIRTEAGQTHFVSDTLTGLAMVRGKVVEKSTGLAVAGVAFTLLDSRGNVAASMQSTQRGLVEIRNVADGSYTIQAGKEGAVTDTIRLVGSTRSAVGSGLIVADGRPFAPPTGNDTVFVDTVKVIVRKGDRYLTWRVERDGKAESRASVKVSSPLLKTLAPGDTLARVGKGTYIITVDATPDSLIDLSRHVFVVDASTPIVAVDTVMDTTGRIDTVAIHHTETLRLPVTHTRPDTASLTDGKLDLSLRVLDTTLDDACIYYRDEAATTFDSLCLPPGSGLVDRGIYTYTFSVAPRKNGSTMLYFFRVRIGNDWYGYDKEVRRLYVRADTTRLSRIEIVPSSADTILLPAESEVTFRFRGYFGSRFIPATSIADNAVAWTLKAGTQDAPRGMLGATSGVAVTVDPDKASGGSTVYTLTATIDTTKRRVVPGVVPALRVHFSVSTNKLDSIRIVRVGSTDGAITTSALSKAEFVAEGLDDSGSTVMISPEWRIDPPSAGSIGDEGVFRPARNFVGWVRIMAEVGRVGGEYNRRSGRDANKSGLQVHHIVGVGTDTASNGRACTIIFPDSVAPAGKTPLTSLERPALRNRVALNTGDFTVVSDIHDIEAWDLRTGGAISFRRSKPIRLILDVPEDYSKQVENDVGEFAIGRWNPDSVQWVLLDSCELDKASMSISATVHGFSRYAVLYKMEALKGIWAISPNPFSPYVRPVNEVGRNAPAGTCIRIRPVAPTEPINVRVDIYNIASERVWSVAKQSAQKNQEIRLWWDGKSLSDTYIVGGRRETRSDEGVWIMGERMCRNGRYFAVLTVTAGSDKREYMKPIILFK